MRAAAAIARRRRFPAYARRQPGHGPRNVQADGLADGGHTAPPLTRAAAEPRSARLQPGHGPRRCKRMARLKAGTTRSAASGPPRDPAGPASAGPRAANVQTDGPPEGGHYTERRRVFWSEHPRTDGDRGDRRDEVADEPRGHRVPRASYAHGAEVHRQHVEGRLRRPVHRRCHAADERVRSVCLDEIGGNGERAAAAQRAQDRERYELRRESRWTSSAAGGPRSAGPWLPNRGTSRWRRGSRPETG